MARRCSPMASLTAPSTTPASTDRLASVVVTVGVGQHRRNGSSQASTGATSGLSPTSTRPRSGLGTSVAVGRSRGSTTAHGREPVAPLVGVPRVAMASRGEHWFGGRFGRVAGPAGRASRTTALYGDPAADPVGEVFDAVQAITTAIAVRAPDPRSSAVTAGVARARGRRLGGRIMGAGTAQLRRARWPVPPRCGTLSRIWRPGRGGVWLAQGMALTPHPTRSTMTKLDDMSNPQGQGLTIQRSPPSEGVRATRGIDAKAGT